MRPSPLLALSFVAILSACTPADKPDRPPVIASSAAASGDEASSAFPQPDWSQIPGALVRTSMHSVVGVLLDDIPAADRERFEASLLAKPVSFWEERARRQIRLTSLHLNFRNSGQLPLPPEELWEISIPNPPQRRTINGHALIVVDYAFSSVLLTDAESPAVSEDVLAEAGGVWNQPFLFPVDPELLFQRTGYACYNESQFPPNSVDAEEADLFYDFECRAQQTLSNTTCHQTQTVDRSCADAVKEEIGSIGTAMRYERLAWDPVLADSVRTGEVTNLDGPDLQPYAQGFRQHRFTYRYITPNSCTLIEKCVGGSGWRKLLMFPTGDINVGTEPLDIGLVDYFGKMGGTPLSRRGVFEYSACHRHYHFSQYGSFTLDGGDEAITRKNGFCLQPSARMANNELSPLQHKYVDCVDQGVSVGWIDEYKMGLECQWLDVTPVAAGAQRELSFTTNPEAFLCEGKPVRDANGEQLFEPTALKTALGNPIDRPVCDQFPGWDANNTTAYGVTIPANGDGYVTEPCREGLFGEKRNCGFTNNKTLSECAPGSTVTLRCSVPAGSATQAVRVCEGSRGLQSGIPCTFNDALGSITLNAAANVTFTCPKARDGIETGGSYSFMTAPLLPGDTAANVTCLP